MKKKQLFVIAFFALIPLLAFAESYGFIVGGGPDCGINTIPKFIKATLEMVVKVGIPVASVFIILAGFQFLTAQGNEGKLKSAKAALLWSCIGFGVLLGAWIFATAFLGTLTAITGGSAEDAIITPCGSVSDISSNPVLPKKETLSPSIQTVLIAEGNTHAGLGSIFGVGGECASYSGNYVPTDIMEDNSLDSSDLNLLSKSLSIVQRDAILKNTEQAYLFVQFNSGGGAFLHTAGGNSISTEFPPIKTIENVVIEPSLSGVSSIRVIHTHPASFFQGSIPPSLNDLLLADDISNNNPKTMYYHDVADFGGMWEYSVSPSSVFGQVAALIKENMKKILALPEVQGKVSLNKCSPVAEVVGVFESSLNAVYGISAQTMAREMNKKANEAMDPFYEQDSRLRSTASDDERKSIFKERESLERSLGISLKYTQM